MKTGKQEATSVAQQDQTSASAPTAERRKTQRRSPPPEIGSTGSFRVDDRRLCRGRRWDDWRRS
jgi:hypothetical protein